MKKNRFVLLIIALIVSVTHLFAQQKNLNYSIISKGDTVGKMQIMQHISGTDISYSVSSTVTTKMLMTIKVNVHEEAQYHNKKLMSSSSQRIINDKPKANKQTKWYQNYYLVSDDNKQNTLQEKEITYDFSMLYFKEPSDIKKIYSNYYQTNIPIQQQDAHSYQINLPDGGSNTYYYINGVCSHVDMHSTLFNAQMVLVQ